MEAWTFASMRSASTEPGQPGSTSEYADLNQDGRLDIIGGATGGLAWLEQPERIDDAWNAHAIGTFSPDSMTGLEMADINGDGHLDVIGGSYSRGPRERRQE